MFQQTSKKGIAVITGILLLLVAMTLLVGEVSILFWFFRYNITLYIFSDAAKSKSSTIPLILFTSTYDGENLATKLDKIGVGLENEATLKVDIDNIVSNYLVGPDGKPYLCYKFKINSFEIVQSGNGDCKSEMFYRVLYPFPKTYDGVSVTREAEFITNKVGD